MPTLKAGKYPEGKKTTLHNYKKLNTGDATLLRIAMNALMNN